MIPQRNYIAPYFCQHFGVNGTAIRHFLHIFELPKMQFYVELVPACHTNGLPCLRSLHNVAQNQPVSNNWNFGWFQLNITYVALVL
jgi:hypothetical protein